MQNSPRANQHASAQKDRRKIFGLNAVNNDIGEARYRIRETTGQGTLAAPNAFDVRAQLARLDAPSAPIVDSNSLPLPAHFQRVVSSEELIFDSSDDEPELLNDVAAKKDREQRIKIKRETAELERERVELYEAHMQRAAALQADRQAFREQEAADLIKEKRDQDRMQRLVDSLELQHQKTARTSTPSLPISSNLPSSTPASRYNTGPMRPATRDSPLPSSAPGTPSGAATPRPPSTPSHNPRPSPLVMRALAFAYADEGEAATRAVDFLLQKESKSDSLLTRTDSTPSLVTQSSTQSMYSSTDNLTPRAKAAAEVTIDTNFEAFDSLSAAMHDVLRPSDSAVKAPETDDDASWLAFVASSKEDIGSPVARVPKAVIPDKRVAFDEPIADGAAMASAMKKLLIQPNSPIKLNHLPEATVSKFGSLLVPSASPTNAKLSMSAVTAALQTLRKQHNAAVVLPAADQETPFAVEFQTAPLRVSTTSPDAETNMQSSHLLTPKATPALSSPRTQFHRLFESLLHDESESDGEHSSTRLQNAFENTTSSTLPPLQLSDQAPLSPRAVKLPAWAHTPRSGGEFALEYSSDEEDNQADSQTNVDTIASPLAVLNTAKRVRPFGFYRARQQRRDARVQQATHSEYVPAEIRLPPSESSSSDISEFEREHNEHFVSKQSARAEAAAQRFQSPQSHDETKPFDFRMTLAQQLEMKASLLRLMSQRLNETGAETDPRYDARARAYAKLAQQSNRRRSVVYDKSVDEERRGSVAERRASVTERRGSMAERRDSIIGDLAAVPEESSGRRMSITQDSFPAANLPALLAPVTPAVPTPAAIVVNTTAIDQELRAAIQEADELLTQAKQTLVSHRVATKKRATELKRARLAVTGLNEWPQVHERRRREYELQQLLRRRWLERAAERERIQLAKAAEGEGQLTLPADVEMAQRVEFEKRVRERLEQTMRGYRDSFAKEYNFRIDAAVFDASSSHVRVVSKYLAKLARVIDVAPMSRSILSTIRAEVRAFYPDLQQLPWLKNRPVPGVPVAAIALTAAPETEAPSVARLRHQLHQLELALRPKSPLLQPIAPPTSEESRSKAVRGRLSMLRSAVKIASAFAPKADTSANQKQQQQQQPQTPQVQPLAPISENITPLRRRFLPARQDFKRFGMRSPADRAFAAAADLFLTSVNEMHEQTSAVIEERKRVQDAIEEKERRAVLRRNRLARDSNAINSIDEDEAAVNIVELKPVQSKRRMTIRALLEGAAGSGMAAVRYMKHDSSQSKMSKRDENNNQDNSVDSVAASAIARALQNVGLDHMTMGVLSAVNQSKTAKSRLAGFEGRPRPPAGELLSDMNFFPSFAESSFTHRTELEMFPTLPLPKLIAVPLTLKGLPASAFGRIAELLRVIIETVDMELLLDDDFDYEYDLKDLEDFVLLTATSVYDIQELVREEDEEFVEISLQETIEDLKANRGPHSQSSIAAEMVSSAGDVAGSVRGKAAGGLKGRLSQMVESADALKKGLTVTSPAAARAQAAAKKRTEWAKEAALSLAVKSASVAAESKNEENKSHGRTALENLRAQQAEMIRQQKAIMAQRDMIEGNIADHDISLLENGVNLNTAATVQVKKGKTNKIQSLTVQAAMPTTTKTIAETVNLKQVDQYVKVKETMLIKQAAEEVLKMDSSQQDKFANEVKVTDATLFVAVTEEIAAKTLALSEPLKQVSSKFASLRKSDFMLQLEKQLARALTKLDAKDMSQASKLPDAVDVSDSDTSDEDSARDENGVRIRRQKEDETPAEKEPEGEEWEYAYNELGQLVRRLKKKEEPLSAIDRLKMAAGLSTAKSMKDRIRARLRELVAKSRQKNSAAGKKEPRRLRLLKIAPYLDANLLGIKEFDKWNPEHVKLLNEVMDEVADEPDFDTEEERQAFRQKEAERKKEEARKQAEAEEAAKGKKGKKGFTRQKSTGSERYGSEDSEEWDEDDEDVDEHGYRRRRSSVTKTSGKQRKQQQRRTDRTESRMSGYDDSIASADSDAEDEGRPDDENNNNFWTSDVDAETGGAVRRKLTDSERAALMESKQQKKAAERAAKLEAEARQAQEIKRRERESSTLQLSELLTVMAARFKRIWCVCETPADEKLAYLTKYCQPDAALALPYALSLAEECVQLIVWRENQMFELKQFERAASDPRRLFKGSSVHLLHEAKMRRRIVKNVFKTSNRLLWCLQDLRSRFGDILRFRGQPYELQMQHDYSEMLYALQIERKQPKSDISVTSVPQDSALNQDLPPQTALVSQPSSAPNVTLSEPINTVPGIGASAALSARGKIAHGGPLAQHTINNQVRSLDIVELNPLDYHVSVILPKHQAALAQQLYSLNPALTPKPITSLVPHKPSANPPTPSQLVSGKSRSGPLLIKTPKRQAESAPSFFPTGVTMPIHTSLVSLHNCPPPPTPLPPTPDLDKPIVVYEPSGNANIGSGAAAVGIINQTPETPELVEWPARGSPIISPKSSPRTKKDSDNQSKPSPNEKVATTKTIGSTGAGSEQTKSFAEAFSSLLPAAASTSSGPATAVEKALADIRQQQGRAPVQSKVDVSVKVGDAPTVNDKHVSGTSVVELKSPQTSITAIVPSVPSSQVAVSVASLALNATIQSSVVKDEKVQHVSLTDRLLTEDPTANMMPVNWSNSSDRLTLAYRLAAAAAAAAATTFSGLNKKYTLSERAPPRAIDIDTAILSGAIIGRDGVALSAEVLEARAATAAAREAAAKMAAKVAAPSFLTHAQRGVDSWAGTMDADGHDTNSEAFYLQKLRAEALHQMYDENRVNDAARAGEAQMAGTEIVDGPRDAVKVAEEAQEQLQNFWASALSSAAIAKSSQFASRFAQLASASFSEMVSTAAASAKASFGLEIPDFGDETITNQLMAELTRIDDLKLSPKSAKAAQLLAFQNAEAARVAAIAQQQLEDAMFAPSVFEAPVPALPTAASSFPVVSAAMSSVVTSPPGMSSPRGSIVASSMIAPISSIAQSVSASAQHFGTSSTNPGVQPSPTAAQPTAGPLSPGLLPHSPAAHAVAMNSPSGVPAGVPPGVPRAQIILPAHNSHYTGTVSPVRSPQTSKKKKIGSPKGQKQVSAIVRPETPLFLNSSASLTYPHPVTSPVMSPRLIKQDAKPEQMQPLDPEYAADIIEHQKQSGLKEITTAVLSATELGLKYDASYRSAALILPFPLSSVEREVAIAPPESVILDPTLHSAPMSPTAVARMRQSQKVDQAWSELKVEVASRPKSAANDATKRALRDQELKELEAFVRDERMADDQEASKKKSIGKYEASFKSLQSEKTVDETALMRPFATLGYIQLPKEADAVLERAANAAKFTGNMNDYDKKMMALYANAQLPPFPAFADPEKAAVTAQYQLDEQARQLDYQRRQAESVNSPPLSPLSPRSPAYPATEPPARQNKSKSAHSVSVPSLSLDTPKIGEELKPAEKGGLRTVYTGAKERAEEKAQMEAAEEQLWKQNAVKSSKHKDAKSPLAEPLSPKSIKSAISIDHVANSESVPLASAVEAKQLLTELQNQPSRQPLSPQAVLLSADFKTRASTEPKAESPPRSPKRLMLDIDTTQSPAVQPITPLVNTSTAEGIRFQSSLDLHGIGFGTPRAVSPARSIGPFNKTDTPKTVMLPASSRFNALFARGPSSLLLKPSPRTRNVKVKPALPVQEAVVEEPEYVPVPFPGGLSMEPRAPPPATPPPPPRLHAETKSSPKSTPSPVPERSTSVLDVKTSAAVAVATSMLSASATTSAPSSAPAKPTTNAVPLPTAVASFPGISEALPTSARKLPSRIAALQSAQAAVAAASAVSTIDLGATTTSLLSIASVPDVGAAPNTEELEAAQLLQRRDQRDEALEVAAVGLRSVPLPPSAVYPFSSAPTPHSQTAQSDDLPAPAVVYVRVPIASDAENAPVAALVPLLVTSHASQAEADAVIPVVNTQAPLGLQDDDAMLAFSARVHHGFLVEAARQAYLMHEKKQSATSTESNPHPISLSDAAQYAAVLLVDADGSVRPMPNAPALPQRRAVPLFRRSSLSSNNPLPSNSTLPALPSAPSNMLPSISTSSADGLGSSLPVVSEEVSAPPAHVPTRSKSVFLGASIAEEPDSNSSGTAPVTSTSAKKRNRKVPPKRMSHMDAMRLASEQFSKQQQVEPIQEVDDTIVEEDEQEEEESSDEDLDVFSRYKRTVVSGKDAAKDLLYRNM